MFFPWFLRSEEKEDGEEYKEEQRTRRGKVRLDTPCRGSALKIHFFLFVDREGRRLWMRCCCLSTHPFSPIVASQSHREGRRESGLCPTLFLSSCLALGGAVPLTNILLAGYVCNARHLGCVLTWPGPCSLRAHRGLLAWHLHPIRSTGGTLSVTARYSFQVLRI